jgi:flagellar hook protein FlgE
VQLYDSLGRTHTAGLYFRKTALATPDTPTNKWETYVLVDGKQLEPQQSNALSFDTAGRLRIAARDFEIQAARARATPVGKVDPLVLSLDLGKGTSPIFDRLLGARSHSGRVRPRTDPTIVGR